MVKFITIFKRMIIFRKHHLNYAQYLAGERSVKSRQRKFSQNK